MIKKKSINKWCRQSRLTVKLITVSLTEQGLKCEFPYFESIVLSHHLLMRFPKADSNHQY